MLTWKIGQKAAKAIFYPFLLAADRVKTDAFEKAVKNNAPGQMTCGWCKKIVPPRGKHNCRTEGNGQTGSQRPETSCGKCGERTFATGPHRCDFVGAVPKRPVQATPEVLLREAEFDECEFCGGEYDVNDADQLYQHELDYCGTCGHHSDEAPHDEVWCDECDHGHCRESACEE